MKKDIFDKAKNLQSSINTIKKRKEQIERMTSKDENRDKKPIIFGLQGTNFITLKNSEIEYICNYLIKKCDDEIKFLEDEFEKL